MYKWHLHSAIGRGRPAINDFAKVADGIAASLRQFSISAARAAEDGESSKPVSRYQRSAAAVQVLSSLAPSPRGIDARSLGARPPQASLVRRVDMPYKDRSFGLPEGGTPRPSTPRTGAPRTTRGRGGAPRARGAARGRGARGRGRGGKTRGAKKKTNGINEDEIDDDVLTPFEIACMDYGNGGGSLHYEPTTALENLTDLDGPGVLGGKKGVIRNLAHHFQVATDTEPAFSHRPQFEHRHNAMHGDGTFYESELQRIRLDGPPGVRSGVLSPEKKREVANAWVAGHYPKLGGLVESNDFLGQIQKYTLKNETYLPEDRNSLAAKIRSLLPPSMTAPKANLAGKRVS